MSPLPCCFTCWGCGRSIRTVELWPLTRSPETLWLPTTVSFLIIVITFSLTGTSSACKVRLTSWSMKAVSLWVSSKAWTSFSALGLYTLTLTHTGTIMDVLAAGPPHASLSESAVVNSVLLCVNFKIKCHCPYSPKYIQMWTTDKYKGNTKDTKIESFTQSPNGCVWLSEMCWDHNAVHDHK